MKEDFPIKNEIVIPGNELEITTSRSSGAGGQHVNKTETKITIRWNIKNTSVLNDIQKKYVLQNLKNRLTKDGDLVISNSESRSQQQNKENALKNLAQIIRQALHVPKKRIKTKVPKKEKEKRLQEKKFQSQIKKMRSKKIKNSNN
ncbi:aminoacyl-tRNA hydrolase [Candidatus Babeliales bacterium]|nr:aminoacyl-tRNA hydrolase [Candidatus Babeliales bacterium]